MAYGPDRLIPIGTKYKDKLVQLYKDAGWKQVYVRYGNFILEAEKDA